MSISESISDASVGLVQPLVFWLGSFASLPHGRNMRWELAVWIVLTGLEGEDERGPPGEGQLETDLGENKASRGEGRLGLLGRLPRPPNACFGGEQWQGGLSGKEEANIPHLFSSLYSHLSHPISLSHLCGLHAQLPPDQVVIQSEEVADAALLLDLWLPLEHLQGPIAQIAALDVDGHYGILAAAVVT
jgi:hypothetical protein